MINLPEICANDLGGTGTRNINMMETAVYDSV